MKNLSMSYTFLLLLAHYLKKKITMKLRILWFGYLTPGSIFRYKYNLHLYTI